MSLLLSYPGDEVLSPSDAKCLAIRSLHNHKGTAIAPEFYAFIGLETWSSERLKPDSKPQHDRVKSSRVPDDPYLRRHSEPFEDIEKFSGSLMNWIWISISSR